MISNFHGIIHLSYLNEFCSEISYECDEPIHLTERRWRALSAITFSLYSTGASLEERPTHVLNETSLILSFKTTTKFTDFVRRAFFTEGTKLVTFEVTDRAPTSVTCVAVTNLTPSVELFIEDNSAGNHDSASILA